MNRTSTIAMPQAMSNFAWMAKKPTTLKSFIRILGFWNIAIACRKRHDKSPWGELDHALHHYPLAELREKILEKGDHWHKMQATLGVTLTPDYQSNSGNHSIISSRDQNANASAHVCLSEQASKLALGWAWICWLKSEHTRSIYQLKKH